MKHIFLAWLFTLSQLAYGANAKDVRYANQLPGVHFRENHSKNPGFEQNNENSLTDANNIASISSTTPLSGTNSLAIDAGTSGHLVKVLGRTMKLMGGQCEATFYYNGDASLYKAYVLQGSTKVSAEVTLQNVGTSGQLASLPFPCGAGTAPDVTIEATSASAAAMKIDDVYTGMPVNIGTIAQASFFGGMEQAGAGSCVYSENTSTGLSDFKDLGSGSSCSAWTVTGGVTATGTNDHRPVLSNLAPGTYQVIVSGTFLNDTANQLCSFRLSDGTTTYQPQGSAGPNAANGVTANALTYSVSYTTAQSSITLKLQAADNGAGSCSLYNVANLAASWKIYYFPSQAQTAVRMDQSNFDWTACPSGYASSWTANTTTTCKVRRSGSEAEFQMTNTLSGAPTAAALTFTLPTGYTIDTTKLNSPVQYKQTLGKAQGYDDSAGSAYLASVLYNSSTTVVVGYESSTLALTALYNATAPITWASSDVITATFKVPISGWTENQNAPLLVGGVTSNSSGMERVERATVTCSGSSSITSQSGSWVSSVGNVSSGVCSVTLVSGMFSATPTCVVTHNSSDPAVVTMNQLLVNSATSLSYTCRYLNSGSSTVNNCGSASVNIICQGPR